MHWSLSEFLNLLDTRSQCWGVIEMGGSGGFRVRATGNVMFYAMLDGSVAVSGMAGGPATLNPGDCLAIVTNGAQMIRTAPNGPLHRIDFLENDEYADVPYHVSLAEFPAARILCGRLKVRWPAGAGTHSLPPFIKVDSQECVVNLRLLERKARGAGAAAVLTRAAALVLTTGLREHPQCQSIFREANFRDPVSRAIQFMELHAHQEWTVRTLAAKVGMARSTFAGKFQEEVGKPPMEVLTHIRMRRAADLLTQTQLKISEIVGRVGYQSQSAFSRRFECHFKTTPGRMRAQARALPDTPPFEATKPGLQR